MKSLCLFALFVLSTTACVLAQRPRLIVRGEDMGYSHSGNQSIVVGHPGLDTPETRAIHHTGYEDVVIDRQGVTDAWTSEKVKEAILKFNIELISYRDLKTKR
ncbi:MAG TPA: hypothetical protein VFT90_12610 [Chryseosolibacter sp.]|nr:hypothetical protein [Chryseosolibacter sp.]